MTVRVRRWWTALRASLIWATIVRQKWWWLGAVASIGAAGLLLNLTLSATARFVDEAVIERTEPMGPIALRLIVLAVLSAIAGFAVRFIVSRIGIHMEFELRAWLYKGLHGLDPKRLDSVASGQMATRAMTDLYLLMLWIVMIPALVILSTYIGARLIWLFMQNIPMTIVLFLLIPINLWLVDKMRGRMWGFSWLSLNRRAEVTTAFDETVRGIRVTKAFGREDQERTKLADVAGRTFGVVMARTRVLAKFDLVMKTAPMIINAVLILMAARLVGADGVSIGVLIVYLESARRFATFASTLDQIVNAYMWGKSGAGRIFELLGLLDRNVAAPRTGDMLPPVSSGLELADVGVSFDGYQVLSELSLHVRPGELVAVTGPPRSGRSTIAQLVWGMLLPSEGSVSIDGAATATLDPAEVRNAVVVVSEDPFLFARSIRDNLLLGARGEPVGDDELWTALHAAAADEMVRELPAGLDTVIGDRGMTMSGGERQRLGLARALVRPPRLVVLDDALTAVNPSLEVEILRRIRVHAPHSAILCLTRRDAATVVADRAVTLPEPAPGAPPGPTPVDLGPYGTMWDLPYDPKLINIIRQELPPADERPKVLEADCDNSDQPPGIVSTLQPLLKPVVIATCLLMGFTVLGLTPPRLFGLVIDAIQEQRIRQSDLLALAVTGVGVAYAAFAYFLWIYRTRVEESIVYVLRRRVFHRITRLGVDFYDKEIPGYMTTRVVADIDRIGQFVNNAVFKSATTVLQFVIVMAVMLWWSPPVALVAVAATPLLVMLSVVFLPVVYRAYRWARLELGEVVSRLQEDFSGRYELQAYNATERSAAEFDAKAWRLRWARMWGMAIVSNSYAQLVTLTMEIALVALLWVAGQQVLAGVITVGALATLRLYLDQVLDPLPDLAGVVDEYLEVRASILRLREPFLAPIRPPEQPRPAAGEPATNGAPGVPGAGLKLEGEIAFDDVTFAYPNTARPVLENVSVRIDPGQMVAIVGPTGAGKSTIAKLVSRIYDPDTGRILVDGRDLRELDYTAYRRRLGVVPQESFLFRGTVASNVAYGRPDATRQQIEEAAREVSAYDSIRAIPGGLDGFVEEEGRNLTSAQRQLICLVRAWLVEPDILILDEATAVLDAKMEEHIIATLRTLGRTTILITHRLHVARRADRIMVVHRGCVVEDGSHDELVQRRGVYSSLWAHGPELDERSLAEPGA